MNGSIQLRWTAAATCSRHRPGGARGPGRRRRTRRSPKQPKRSEAAEHPDRKSAVGSGSRPSQCQSLAGRCPAARPAPRGRTGRGGASPAAAVLAPAVPALGDGRAGSVAGRRAGLVRPRAGAVSTPGGRPCRSRPLRPAARAGPVAPGEDGQCPEHEPGRTGSRRSGSRRTPSCSCAAARAGSGSSRTRRRTAGRGRRAADPATRAGPSRTGRSPRSRPRSTRTGTAAGSGCRPASCRAAGRPTSAVRWAQSMAIPQGRSVGGPYSSWLKKLPQRAIACMISRPITTRRPR